MAKATSTLASRRYYSDKVRAALQKIVEEARARRGVKKAINWVAVFDGLETLARWHDHDRKRLPVTPREALKKVSDCLSSLDDLLQKLKDPELHDWDFISSSDDSILTLTKSESPKSERIALIPLRASLEPLRNQLLRDQAELAGFQAHGRALGEHDYDRLFKANVLEIGRDLIGEQVGNEDGPLISFCQIALQPVFGDFSPDALRSFARRH